VDAAPDAPADDARDAVDARDAADARDAVDARDAADAGCVRTLSPPVSYKISSWARNLAVGDVDGDGKLDFVVNDLPSQFNDSISVVRNLGARAFAPEVTFPAHRTEIQGLAVGDLDGDGRLDVAACEHLSSTVGVYLNVGGGTLGPRVDTAAGGPADGGADAGPVHFASGLLATDLDGDHRPDLVVGEQDLREASGGGLGVLMNRGDGSLRPLVAYPNTVIAGQRGGTYERGPLALAAADLDGDGSNDVVMANTDAFVAVYLNHGDGTFAPEARTSIGAPGPNGTSTNVAVGDLDGDGHPDLAVLNTFGPSVGVLLNDGHGGFAAEQAVVPQVNLSYSYLFVAIADIDGDGKNDIVTASTDGSGPQVNVFLNRGGAKFAAPVSFISDPEDFVTGLAVADVDGDGRLDVVLVTDRTFHVEVFYGTCAPRPGG
jgi:hypothetical protein